MKTLFILITIFISSYSYGQSKFESAILRGKQMINDADTVTAYQNVANYFQRIAQKETTEWLPLYYQAQVMAFMASNDTDVDSKEAQLKKALGLIESAKKIEKNAELLTLEGFVQMLRLSVDPGTRGQTMTPMVLGLYQQALALEPENPRTLLFLGQMKYGMAQFFGTGTEEACTHVKQAYDIFESQPSDPTVYPTWGMESAKAVLQNCNQ